MNRRLKVWGMSLLTAALLITTAVLVVQHWASTSSDGTTHTGKPVVATVTPTAKEPLALDTSYFTTKLPPGFTLKREEATPSSPILLQLVTTNEHQQFAVTVGIMPDDGLKGIGDYNLRVTKATDYEPYRPAGMPVAATAFRNITGPPGFVAFWPNQSQYTEIALSSDGVDTTPQLFATFEQAVYNWQWEQ